MVNQPNASRPSDPSDPSGAGDGADEVVDGQLVDDADNAGAGPDSGTGVAGADVSDADDDSDDDDVADAELADEPGPAGATADAEPAVAAAAGADAGSGSGASAEARGGGSGPGTAGTGAGQQPSTTVDRPPLTTTVPQTVSPTVVPGSPGTPTAPNFDYTDDGVPTLDYVRDRIEQRYGTALGGTELAESSAAGRAQRDAEAERARLAQEKLAELRAQVDGSNRTVDSADPATTAGDDGRPGGRQVDPPPAG